MTQSGGRVVTKTLADGTIKTYRYGPYRAKGAYTPTGRFTVGDLIAAWQLSPMWQKLAESTRRTYAHNIAALLLLADLPIRSLTRQHLIMIYANIVTERGKGAAATFRTELFGVG